LFVLFVCVLFLVEICLLQKSKHSKSKDSRSTKHQLGDLFGRSKPASSGLFQIDEEHCSQDDDEDYYYSDSADNVP
jgi:hypothetical protein